MSVNIAYKGLLNKNAINELQKSSTTEQLTQSGENLAYVLNIPKGKNGLFKTTWGDKTAYGLYFTVLNLIIED